MENNCNICYDNMENLNITTFHCGHKFHLTCVIRLYERPERYHNKCPMCRTSFYKTLWDDQETETIESEMSELSEDDEIDIDRIITDEEIMEYNRNAPLLRPSGMQFRPDEPGLPTRPPTPSINNKRDILFEKLKKYHIAIKIIVIYICLLLNHWYTPEYIKDKIFTYILCLMLTVCIVFLYMVAKSDEVKYLIENLKRYS